MRTAPYIDFASFSAEQQKFEYYDQKFTLHPDRLSSLKLPVTLRWNQTKFQENNVNAVTEEPGVYAFAVANDAPGLPPHGYILYIGQTKGKTRVKTLRDRMKEYFQERRRPKRVGVWLFLNKWKGSLFFLFAPVDPKRFDLLDIERQLNDAVVPPYSQQDFSPRIRKMQRLRRFK